MTNRRNFLTGSAAGALWLAGASTGLRAQQDYPNRPMRAVIGFPAGSGADILGRYFTAKLQDASGQSVVVENKPGANSNIAAGLVANAKPDGYTMLFIANSNMAGSRFLFKNLPFDTVKDFVPAAAFAQIAFVVVVGVNSPIKTLAELTAHLKSRDKNRYGVTNQMAIITTEYYRQRAGFEAAQVQYRTAPEALPDVENGTLDFVIMDGTFAAGAIRQGKIRALAVTTSRRHPSLPDVPTMHEAGLTNFELAPWWGVYFPAATPLDIVAKVGGWMNKVSATEDAAQFLARVGSFPLVEDGKTAAARLQADIKLWEPIVKAAKIEPQG
jgi:tripartite-type tricarboxylate transporter receptor subunit TctC